MNLGSVTSPLKSVASLILVAALIPFFSPPANAMGHASPQASESESSESTISSDATPTDSNLEAFEDAKCKGKVIGMPRGLTVQVSRGQVLVKWKPPKRFSKCVQGYSLYHKNNFSGVDEIFAVTERDDREWSFYLSNPPNALPAGQSLRVVVAAYSDYQEGKRAIARSKYRVPSKNDYRSVTEQTPDRKLEDCLGDSENIFVWAGFYGAQGTHEALIRLQATAQGRSSSNEEVGRVTRVLPVVGIATLVFAGVSVWKETQGSAAIGAIKYVRCIRQ